MSSGSPDRVASSRLLTMAFMQRAIAKDGGGGNVSSPTTPASSKKRKTGNSQSGRTPEQQPHAFDQAALDAALADEERKRQAALEQRARDLGDSRWVLRRLHNATLTGNPIQKPLDVVYVGFGEIYEDSESSKPPSRRYFNTKTPAKDHDSTNQGSNEHSSESDDDGSDSDSSDSDSSNSDSSDSDSSNSGKDQKQQAARENKPKVVVPSKRRAEFAKANLLAEKRRKKEINLNRPTSISSISATKFRSGAASPSLHDMVCFGCGKKGHPKAKCPQPGGFRSSRGR